MLQTRHAFREPINGIAAKSNWLRNYYGRKLMPQVTGLCVIWGFLVNKQHLESKIPVISNNV